MLISAFFLALLAFVLLSSHHLLYFAPVIAVAIYRKPRLYTLWIACGCGVVVDLLSSSPYFGINALAYVMATFLLHGQRRSFFEDKLSTLPIVTFLFSFLATAIHVPLQLFFGKKFELSWEWGFSDLLVMPFYDALYALLWFALPFQIFHRLSKLILYARLRKTRR